MLKSKISKCRFSVSSLWGHSKVFCFTTEFSKAYNRYFLAFLTLLALKMAIIQKYWGAGLLWGFINPRNFHFYCIFGPLFWPVGFHQGQNFSKNRQFFEKRPIFALFCPKMPFLGPKTLFFSKFRRLRRRNVGFHRPPSAAEVWNLGPPWAEAPPPISLMPVLNNNIFS